MDSLVSREFTAPLNHVRWPPWEGACCSANSTIAQEARFFLKCKFGNFLISNRKGKVSKLVLLFQHENGALKIGPDRDQSAKTVIFEAKVEPNSQLNSSGFLPHPRWERIKPLGWESSSLSNHHVPHTHIVLCSTSCHGHL